MCTALHCGLNGDEATENGPATGVYSSYAEAIMARDRGVLGLPAPIKVRISHLRPPA